MGRRALLAGALASASLLGGPALAEPVVWGVQAEWLERRFGEGSDIHAWHTKAFAGKDELRAVWLSEAEHLVDEDEFEVLENELRLQAPVSAFFDAVAGVRFDTPEGPDRAYVALGVHGLAPQWLEVDAVLYVSKRPTARLKAEYEGLITNRVILVPSVEVDVPLADDVATGQGGFAPTLELGARLSYDLIDRSVAPYVGVHWERAFGETASLARAEGEDASQVYLVAGLRLMF